LVLKVLTFPEKLKWCVCGRGSEARGYILQTLIR